MQEAIVARLLALKGNHHIAYIHPNKKETFCLPLPQSNMQEATAVIDPNCTWICSGQFLSPIPLTLELLCISVQDKQRLDLRCKILTMATIGCWSMESATVRRRPSDIPEVRTKSVKSRSFKAEGLALIAGEVQRRSNREDRVKLTLLHADLDRSTYNFIELVNVSEWIKWHCYLWYLI